MKRPFPLRSVNESVGAFVLGAGLALIFFAVLTIRVQDWFKPELNVKVLLPEAGTFGLATGADVEVLGAVVGSVEDISIDSETERLYATVLVRGEFRSLVRGDSRVIIERKLGLAGDAFLSIVGGKRGVPVEQDSPLVATTTSGIMEGLEATLDEVSENLIPAIHELKGLLRESTGLVRDVRHPDAPIMSFVARMEELSRLALNGEGLVGRILSDPAFAKEVEKTMADTQELLATMNDASASARRAADELTALTLDLRHETPALIGQGTQLLDAAGGTLNESRGLLDEVASILEDVKRTTEPLPEIASGIREEMQDMPGMAADVQDSVREFERLVEALQRHWLVRSYVEQDAPAGRISPLAVPLRGQ